MPQARGSATWLTNVKRTPSAAEERRAGIDESSVKAANGRMEEALEDNMDRLDLQRHRRRADTDFEIAQIREDVRRWERIQSILGQDFVVRAMDMRRQVRLMYNTKDRLPPATSTTEPGPSPRPHTSLRKDRPKAVLTPGSDRSVHMTSAEVLPSRTGATRSKSATPWADRQPRAAWPAGTAEGTAWTASPSTPTPTPAQPQRPKTAHAAMPPAPQRDKRKRAKTALGFHRPRQARARSSHSVVPSRKPGRSFAQLRELTDIEILSEDKPVGKRDEVHQVRHQRHVEEKCDIERRLRLFYVDVEEFKRRDRPQKGYEHVLLDAW